MAQDATVQTEEVTIATDEMMKNELALKKALKAKNAEIAALTAQVEQQARTHQ